MFYNCGHNWIASRSTRDHAMLTTDAKSAVQSTFHAAKKAIPHMIAHKISTTIQNASKKRMNVERDAKNMMNINRLLAPKLIVLDRVQ